LPGDFGALCQKNGGVYKRIRKRPRKEPLPEVYELKVEALKILEEMSEQGLIDLYYGDESRISLEPCVPYAWQFKDEELFMPSTQGRGLNCFALLSRDNQCCFETTQKSIDAHFIVEQLEELSLSLQKVTVVVLDNAPVHVAKPVQERKKFWQARGLFIFYLPPYCPHLNIVEVLWRRLKYQWLQARDYLENQSLFYKVRQALAAVGTLLKIHFAPFQHTLN
jgi:transposase